MIISAFFSILIIFCLLSSTNQQPEPVWTDNCLYTSPTGSGTCIQCVQGFYLMYFLCLPCAPLCKCTTQYNFCQSCASVQYKDTIYNLSSYFNPSQGRCYFCNTTITNCLQCSNQSYCTQCFGGYYTVSTFNQAGQVIGTQCSTTQCQTNSLTGNSTCEICLNQNQCQYCVEGYYLDAATKICSIQQCQSKCLQCQGQSICKQCLPQYFLNQTSQCSPCIGNCTYCINGTVCQVCFPGYYFDSVGGECTPSCCPNCIVYAGGAENATLCNICEPGYFVLYGSCYQCVGCLLCSLQFLCQSSCYSNTTPFNYACLTPLFSAHQTFSFLLLVLIYLLL